MRQICLLSLLQKERNGGTETLRSVPKVISWKMLESGFEIRWSGRDCTLTCYTIVKGGKKMNKDSHPAEYLQIRKASLFL